MNCNVCDLLTNNNMFLFMDVLLQTGIWSCSGSDEADIDRISLSSRSSESCDCILPCGDESVTYEEEDMI